MEMIRQKEELIEKLAEEIKIKKEKIAMMQRSMAQQMQEKQKLFEEVLLMKSLCPPEGGGSSSVKQIEQQIREEKPIEPVQKKYYVVFNGPGAGVYDEWFKAKPWTEGSNITHQAYPNKVKAETAFTEYKAQNYKSVLEKPPSPRTDKKPMFQAQSSFKKIGTIPTIQTIMTQEQKRNMIKLSKDDFLQYFNQIAHYEDKYKIHNFYPVTYPENGPKAVVLPEATPLITYKLTFYGLVDTIYLNEKSQLDYFPEYIKKTILIYFEKFCKGRPTYIRIKSTYPEFDEEGNTSVKAYQVIKIGVSNGLYPDISEVQAFEERIEDYIAQCHRRIYIEECRLSPQDFRMNYSSPEVIILSYHKDGMNKETASIWKEYLERILHNEVSQNESIQKKICQQFEGYSYHICLNCCPEESMTEEMTEA